MDVNIVIKRIYDEPSDQDGYRVLVDRLWPRGVSKDRAKLNVWLKDIAPSTELRTWFDHKAERFTEFSKLYKAELANNPVIDQLEKNIKTKKLSTITLLYAAHDPQVNHAIILRSYLEESFK